MRIRLPFAVLTIFISVFATETFAEEGRTVGQFAVSQYGSAQYSIPIWAPPGPRGMQPNLSLLYDSQSSIGPLGIGWSLAGLGQITRCNLTVAQDTTPAPVALVTSDGYCINGSRLRLTSGTYGTAGSVYQTEVADFSQITAVGTAGNGPASFTVQGRNGLTYYYGCVVGTCIGANSQVLANGTANALTWLLSKVVDRAGNNYVVNYLATNGTTLSGATVPHTILWTPVSAGSSSYSYTMQFNYSSNVPQSSINQYVAGTLVSNSELLSSIEIFSASTVVKDYFLGYQTSPLTGRKELISVTECADSGESTCLKPTTIGYQAGSPGMSTVSNSALSNSGGVFATRYDFNGDGYPDLIYNNGTTWFVAFGSASGYGTPFNTAIPVGSGPALFGNVTGAGQDGILIVVGGTWTYYGWNGSGFTGTSTGLAYDSTSTNYELADVNGDGLPDLVSQKNTTTMVGGHNVLTAKISFQLNTSTSTAASYSSTLTTGYTNTGSDGVALRGPDTQWGKMRRYDFNGDGRDDLVLEIQSGTAPNLTLSTYELISTGTAFTAVNIASVASSATFIPVFFVNWNDDKCTDFVTSNTLYISGCNGSAPQTYPLPGTILVGLDWDGDGRTDILVQNGSTIGVYLSQGSGAPSLTATSFPFSASCTYMWMDANGDGLDDLGCESTSPFPLTYYLHNGTSDLAISFADGYGNSVNAYYTSIAQGAYTNTTDAVFPYQNYIGPMYVVYTAHFSDPSKAPGQTYSQSYHYSGAWTNLQGRGFEGFQARSTTDTRTALYETQYYERAFPYTGMLYEDVWSNGSVYPTITEGGVATIMLSNASNNQRYFPYFSFVTRNDVEVGGTENGISTKQTETSYSYDNYGNATQITTTVTDKDPGSPNANPYVNNTWTTTTTNTTDISVNQSADLAAWCLNMLDETQVVYSSTLAGSASVTRTKMFTPDLPADCRIKTVVTEPTANSSLYKVTEALIFDSFGNVQTDTVTGNNMPASPASRETQLNWGTTGQFLNTLTDPSNATTTWSYNSPQALAFGVPDSLKNANTLTTSWVYDLFGRKTKETRPDTTSTTWTWSACSSFCGWSNSVYQIAQTAYQANGTTVIRTDTAAYDSIDRVTQRMGPTVTGASATVQTLYNSFGLLAQQSMPFFSGTPYLQTYLYDGLNRLSSVTRPISSTNSSPQSTRFAYAGRTLTVTDPYGHNKTTITDVNGWLRQTQDAVGFYVTKAYDSAGSVIGVTDKVGNSLLKSVTYAYGIKPFLLAATDADRGAWTYTVDSLGERTGWTDAKGQAFSMTYDALSRPLTRTEPDLFSQWTYGSTPASHNVGQLISECSGAGTGCSSQTYSEGRTFDGDGRPSTRAITEAGNPGNDPGGVFLFTNGYDSTTGLLKTLTYPITTSGTGSPLTIQYGYQNGLLQSVTDTTDSTSTCGDTCALWTANAMNAFGQITQETLGNGVMMNHAYDPVTSWISAATAGVGGGAALLNQSYLEDENGNIIQRQQNNAPGITESFAYDADNRLICTALSSTCTTPTLAYDAGVAGPGNITSQTGVGTYSYPAAGQPRPHAVTSITGTLNGIVNPAFAYDANGNMTNRASTAQNIYWLTYNYPSSITATDATGSEAVSFNYGPDRQLVGQNYNGPSGYQTAYYVGGLIDVVFSGGANYRQYIYAGGEPIAVYSRTASGVNTVSYLLEDHQGSLSAITSNTGGTTGPAGVDESFSAFGARRNPTTWSGAPTATDLSTIGGLSRQGYTFQMWLGQSMGLNHMKGRVEDAILGRFLSPDPLISDPSNAQSYNRYSYVNNNPLTYIDPTGFVQTCGRPGMHPTLPGPDGCGGDAATVVWDQLEQEEAPWATSLPGDSSILGALYGPLNGLLCVQNCGLLPGGSITTCVGDDPSDCVTSTSASKQDPDAIFVSFLSVGSTQSQAQSPKQSDPRCNKPLRGNTTVTQNINFLRQVSYMSNGNAAPFVAWLMNVAPGGAWDYKNGSSPQNFDFNDMMGNFNYGATGSLFFSPYTLFNGAGAVNTGPGDGHILVQAPFGDDLQGNAQINQGINGGC